MMTKITLVSSPPPPASSQTNKPRLPPGVVDDLASGVAAGSKPASVLKQLHDLKSLVHRRERDRLEVALQELRSSSSMSAGRSHLLVFVHAGSPPWGSAPSPSLTRPRSLKHVSFCLCSPLPFTPAVLIFNHSLERACSLAPP